MREREAALMSGENSPESPDEFDRLIIGSPNSSYLWIKYIAFYLKVGKHTVALRWTDPAAAH